jgi:hypothetical protein
MHLVDVNVRLDWCDTSAKIASILLESCLQKAGLKLSEGEYTTCEPSQNLWRRRSKHLLAARIPHEKMQALTPNGQIHQITAVRQQ